MNENQVKLDDVADIMDERGITAEDICTVIAWAEDSGIKLVDGDRNLAKKRLDNVTVYVEYTVDGAGYVVSDTYSHRVTLREDE